MVGEPSRALPDVDFALGGRDFQGDTGSARADRRRAVQRLRARDLGGAHQPLHHAPLARDASTRRRRAGRSSSPPPAPRSSRTRTTGSSAGSSPARSCSSSSDAERGRRTPTASCSTIPAQAEELGRRARERVLDEHTYRHRARQLLGCSACARRRVSLSVKQDRDRPGVQRGAEHRPRDRRAARVRPASSTSSSSPTARVDRTAEVARGARRARGPAAVQPRHRRRRADRLPLRVGERLRARRPLSTATASTTRPSCRRCSRRCSPARPTSRRLALRRRRGLPLVARRGGSASGCSR